MRNPNQQPLPQATDPNPVELELLAIQELATHPEALQVQLVFMAALAVSGAIESMATDTE